MSLDLAKLLGIIIQTTKYPKKEQETVNYILKAFKGEDTQKQYSIGNYRIDIYFTKYKIAVECDEYGHQDREIAYSLLEEFKA